ncbi:SOS response-associated peptidase [Streptacidiphilus sp. 4-A2]|nr:SOS response-associated peptidase [Streptacidiphilus sp. 4-A2]
MCGRYASSRRPEDLAELFDARLEAGAELPPSWNVAPTDPVWAVLERPAPDDPARPVRQLRVLRWGLVPSWAKDPRGGARMINARVESVHEKPAYRKAFGKRRCLLPADGFYEWDQAEGLKGRAKQAYYLPRRRLGAGDGRAVRVLARPHPARGRPAGWLTTCTVITTDATDAAGRVHPRMPLVIPADSYRDWLDPRCQDADGLRALLAVPADGELEVRAVSAAVGSVRNNGPELIARWPSSGPSHRPAAGLAPNHSQQRATCRQHG